MSIMWGSLAGLLLYLEIVYHICGFGFSGCNPIYTLFLIMAWSSAETMLIGLLKGRWKKIVYYFCVWLPILWSCAQLVYLRIFRQPLLWEAVFRGGQDALTNYWREALEGIVGALPFLLLMILPGVLAGVLLHWKKWKLPSFSTLQVLRMTVALVSGIVGCIATMQIGKYIDADYYEDYQEFFDPLTIAENMGVLPMLQRDTTTGIGRFVEDIIEGFGREDKGLAANASVEVAGGEQGNEESKETEGEAESGALESSEPETEEEEQEPVILPHQLNIDFELLHSLADNNKQTWLADYIQGLTPTTTNEYTGIFEGYNLIYLTAEGFSPYAVREDLTPTLYRLIHSGFVFENYYVPLWQTSTSDGEYINCTALIPDGQFSMRKSEANNMAFTLPRFFEQEGITSYAYHNNSLSYYDRYLTHPNLGYDFRGCKLGELSQEEWGDKIFPMENPGAWPASDLEMMQGTVPQYINNERFHVYYMTVSGHMNYNFKGNAMSSKNREAVAELDMSENARAYIACNIELDKALEYLLQQLEAAGKLENTVICMSADHYPYAMTEEQYEELAGRDLSEGKDLYRNNLILWNAAMEEEPVYVKKACGSMDIVPTLLNLFGFSYDSRMYAGRDIFSDEEGMVIFNDRSFVTDSCIYNRKTKETIWLSDEEGNVIIPEESREDYLSRTKQEVKDRYQFSAYILQENYYQDVKDAIGQ